MHPRTSSILLFSTVLLMNGCGHPGKLENGPFRSSLREASGITRYRDTIYIVFGDTPGCYFTLPAAGRETELSIAPPRLTCVPWSLTDLPLDLESIDVLPDGRIAVLSERHRAVLVKEGSLIEYGGNLSEFGGRGLEGLAIRRLADGAAGIAVLWEGGFPSKNKVPKQLEGLLIRLRPLILVYHLQPGEMGIKIRHKSQKPGELPDPFRRVTERPVKLLVERVRAAGSASPSPLQLKADDDFRAPDLVWHEDSKRGWIFIVLLTIRRRSSDNDSYEYTAQLLQRFTPDGAPLGDPLELGPRLPADLKQANWEGLGWYTEGKRLILSHEMVPGVEGHPRALVVDLPPEWRAD